MTKTTLEHLENILTLAKYKVRYERGVFQSNHCILMDKRLVVINKFLPLEGRISVLTDIINQCHEEIDTIPLDNTLQKVYNDCLGEASSVEV